MTTHMTWIKDFLANIQIIIRLVDNLSAIQMVGTIIVTDYYKSIIQISIPQILAQ